MAKFVCYLAILALLAVELHVAHACVNPRGSGAVAGIITCNGKPVAAGKSVLAYDYDQDDTVRNPDEFLNSGTTFFDGAFYIPYRAGVYGSVEECPDIYIKVDSKSSPKRISNNDNSNRPPTIIDLDICV